MKMRIPFYKYQATANDFIIINQMVVPYLKKPESALIEGWCSRRWGIGADGLMLIVPSEIADFKMIYYNSDGRLSTMCGNGGRAISHLAATLKISGREGKFEAVDGIHHYKVKDSEIFLSMMEVSGVQQRGEQFVIDTGSPHYVLFKQEIDQLDLVKEAREIRYSDEYADQGINVNFVEEQYGQIYVRTYERGVEDETFSCGTGVVASAIAHCIKGQATDGLKHVYIHTKGGPLQVKFNSQQDACSDIWLIGPAIKVFEGSLDYQSR
jgi:diaminopimelate epimerase